MTKKYTASEVAELLLIAEEEAQSAVEKAYAEGYKSGVLEYAPENAGLKALNEYLKAENQKLQKQAGLPMWGVPALVLAGFAGGLLVNIR